jgi:diguanylate cyclase
MLFGRKALFATTDAFAASDVMPDFDESTQAPAAPLQQRSPAAAQEAASHKELRRWLVVAALVMAYAAGVVGFYGLGVVQERTLGALAGMVAAVFGVFGLVVWQGWNQRLRDRYLKVPIVACMLGCMTAVFYLDPVTQILFAPFAFVAVAYGVFTISRPLMLRLVLLALLAYAGVMAVQYQSLQNLALLRLQGLHLLALALSLPAFVLLMGRVQRMHRVLYHAKRKIKNIQEDAQRDALTGCFNRRYVLAVLEEQKQLADESGIALCLAVLDIDHFKHINDKVGHLGGDQVLRDFGRLVLQHMRSGEVFGRYGGEEFLLICPATALLPALNLCERIRAQIELHAWDSRLPQGVTVSVGVTQYVLGESVIEFFSRADTAMYLAKEGGRNQVVVEEPLHAQGAPASGAAPARRA